MRVFIICCQGTNNWEKWEECFSCILTDGRKYIYLSFAFYYAVDAFISRTETGIHFNLGFWYSKEVQEMIGNIPSNVCCKKPVSEVNRTS